jgi:hypothetical protein
MTRIDMTRIRLLLLATVMTIAAACGKAPAPESAAPAATTAESPPASIATPAPAAEAQPDSAAAAVEESAGTEATDAAVAAATAADKVTLGKDIVLADNSSAAPARTDWQYQEGQHFSTLTSAQGTSRGVLVRLLTLLQPGARTERLGEETAG